MTFKVFMALVGCSFAFVGSQMIPLMYLTLYTTVQLDLGASSWQWLAAASTLGQVAASVSLGPLSDLIGRKSLIMAGVFFSLIGMVAVSATPTPSGFIAGQAIAGYGLIIEELLSIAIVAELVPTKSRTLYGSMMIAGFIPWAPGALYAQLLTSVNWRWVGVVIGIWNVMTIVILGMFYNPPPRVNARGLSKREIIDRIDFVGIFLGLGGLTVFLMGLFWGDNPYSWHSPHVIGASVAGGIVLLIFIIWELYGARYPLFPRRLVHVPRSFWAIMFVIFTAGVNWIPLVIFWPIESVAVFNTGHIRTGINSVPIGICILFGAIMSAVLCSVFKRQIHWVMTLFCVLQTVGVGCLAAVKADSIGSAMGPLIVGLWGVGGVLFPNQLVVTIITPDDLLATVTSLTFTIRGVGQVISVAILQNRFIHAVTKNSIKYVAFPAFSVGFRSIDQITWMMYNLTAMPLTEYVQYLPTIDTPQKYDVLRLATQTAFIKSFPIVYYIGLAFGGAACIACFIMGDISKYMDEHVAVVLH